MKTPAPGARSVFLTALFLLLSAALAACGKGTKLPAPETLPWTSEHVTRTMELPLYRLEDGQVPPLPEDIIRFFQGDYGKLFEPDSIYPLMGYSIGRGDLNRDGLEDYVTRGWPNMGGQLLPDAYLFLAQPEGGYQRIFLGLQENSVRLLDSETNGLPDILYGILGEKMTFDGTGRYIPSGVDAGAPPRVLSLSTGEQRENGYWVPLWIRLDLPENSVIAAHFSPGSGLKSSICAWVCSSDGTPVLSQELQGDGSCGVLLQLAPGEQPVADAPLLPDELQIVPAAGD